MWWMVVAAMAGEVPAWSLVAGDVVDVRVDLAADIRVAAIVAGGADSTLRSVQHRALHVTVLPGKGQRARLAVRVDRWEEEAPGQPVTTHAIQGATCGLELVGSEITRVTGPAACKDDSLHEDLRDALGWIPGAVSPYRTRSVVAARTLSVPEEVGGPVSLAPLEDVWDSKDATTTTYAGLVGEGDGRRHRVELSGVLAPEVGTTGTMHDSHLLIHPVHGLVTEMVVRASIDMESPKTMHVEVEGAYAANVQLGPAPAP